MLLPRWKSTSLKKKYIRCASTEPPEFCTDFLLHFKAALLLLWLVTVVLLQETNCVRATAEGIAGEKGSFCYF